MTAKVKPSFEFTVGNQRRDFPEWHRGRARYVLWALHWDTQLLRARYEAAQAELADLLLDGYCRQPHITLSLCGFPSLRPQRADEWGPQHMQAQLRALARLRPAPFAIEIGGLDSFSSVPFFRVSAAPGELQALRHALEGAAPMMPNPDYIPHVTVGLYSQAWPWRQVRARLAQGEIAAPMQPLRTRVTGIVLLSYAAAEIGGPLQTLADYDFASGRLHWHAPPLFEAR